MFRFTALFVLFGLSAFSVNHADDGEIGSSQTTPVLVELFANQNCSACPQAHKTMREISAERDDVLVLTWVVDYWDYLGEPDPMAMPEAKARQADYADWLNLRAPYTPQSVYNGVKECPGPKRRQVVRNIETLSAEPRGDVALIENEGLVSVTGDAGNDLKLYAVTYLSAGTHETGMVNPVV